MTPAVDEPRSPPGTPPAPAGGRGSPRASLLPLLLLAALAFAGAAPAQGWGVEGGGWVIPLVTHASPAVGGESATEGYLSQPVLMAHARGAGGRITVTGMVNLEGLTLRRGELNAGIWGEGYVDRRHPHTYLHELMGSVRVLGGEQGRVALSASAGRGFAPFGTDDPMARPLVKFPANHHLSHLLERYVGMVALRAGPLALEGGLFNGNEPTGPEDLEGLRRFGDSWASRVTMRPAEGVELQGSHARVTAPDFPPEAESEHRKWSGAARYERGGSAERRAYALVEWAWTGEYFSGERAHDFRTVLVEGALRRGAVEVAGRWERTTRPEEERLANPFRTPVPHADVHLLGLTRWHILSARVELWPGAELPLRLRPFVEVGRATAAKVLPGQVFDPAAHFGDDRIWNLSLGARLEAGVSHPRMGRYGAALAPRGPAAESGHGGGHHE